MREGRATAWAVAAALTLLCLMAAALRRGPVTHHTDVHFNPPTLAEPTSSTPTPSANDADGVLPSFETAAPALTTIFYVVAGSLLALAVALILVGFLRALLERAQRHRQPVPKLPEPLQVVAASVARALNRLQVGTPSNAVIAAWVELQSCLDDLGFEHRPSETSAELTLRVLSDLDVDHQAMHDLAALYREARFSSHPLTESDREAARKCLDVLGEGLLPQNRRVQL